MNEGRFDGRFGIRLAGRSDLADLLLNVAGTLDPLNMNERYPDGFEVGDFVDLWVVLDYEDRPDGSPGIRAFAIGEENAISIAAALAVALPLGRHAP